MINVSQLTEQNDFQALTWLKLCLFSTETDSVYYAGFSAFRMNPILKWVLERHKMSLGFCMCENKFHQYMYNED